MSVLIDMPFEKAKQAVLEVNINRAEYMLTQANCHKRNCKCSYTGNGRPEEALQLIQQAIIDDLYWLAISGETRQETDLANLAAERREFEEWKKTRGDKP